MELPQSKIWKSTEKRSWWEPLTQANNKVDETKPNMIKNIISITISNPGIS